METNRTFAFWFLIGVGTILNIMYLIGQTMAIINYDFTVSMDLQEPVTEITEVGVALNKGFGLGDTFIYMPLFIAGIIGLIRRSTVGFYMMIGAMGITIYWPVVSLATLYYAKSAAGWRFNDYTSYTIVLSLITLYGIWGFWYLINNREVLLGNSHDKTSNPTTVKSSS